MRAFYMLAKVVIRVIRKIRIIRDLDQIFIYNTLK